MTSSLSTDRKARDQAIIEHFHEVKRKQEEGLGVWTLCRWRTYDGELEQELLGVFHSEEGAHRRRDSFRAIDGERSRWKYTTQWLEVEE